MCGRGGGGGGGWGGGKRLEKTESLPGMQGRKWQRKSAVETRLLASSIICKALSGWGLDGEVCVGSRGGGGAIVRQRWVGY